MRSWSARRWSTAAVATLIVGLAIGLPTVLIDNPWFHRMMPTEWWNYPAWALSSVLAGLLIATYVRQPDQRQDPSLRRGGLGGLLAFFAVGCPVCNKLVVLALGTSGAMSWFAPLQPILALLAVALLAVALRARLRNERACAVPTAPQRT